MVQWGGRLSTITAVVLPAAVQPAVVLPAAVQPAVVIPGDEIEVIYHYYLEHEAINLKVTTRHNALPSISAVLPAADWIEREIQDLYRITFTGHPHPDRLILPAQIEPGLLREPGGAAEKNRS
jgi:NADH:ubiquinone oxidoreductase subunit C